MWLKTHRPTILWLNHHYSITLPAYVLYLESKLFDPQFRNVSHPQQKSVGSSAKVLKEFQVLSQFKINTAS